MTGIVGQRRLTYDIWGEAVNVAQQLKAACPPGRVVVSESVYQRVRHVFQLEPCATWAMREGELGAAYFLPRVTQ